MRSYSRWVAVVSGWGVLLLAAGAATLRAQESHIGKVTGHAAAGKPLYQRYCIGCHGPDGDGAGENAPWIDPKPRDFTLAVFKCRSTPTGTLPTDQDLLNAMTRGFVTTNMPPWRPLTNQNRADLVAYIKTFSSKWKTLKPGTPITIPAEPRLTIESVLHGRGLYQEQVGGQKVDYWNNGERFVFFANSTTGRANVLYRRYDGHYGLIAPD